MEISKTLTERRRRGVILSLQGWQRLQASERLSAQRDNDDYPYTLEQLSLMTGLSTNTLTKVRRRQKPVDISTLDIYFQSFSLDLSEEDYSLPETLKSATEPTFAKEISFSSPLSCDSPLYIHRSPIERSCFQEILIPGALVRVKAPSQFGKTSLLNILAEYSKRHELRSVTINLKLLDRSFLDSTNKFLKWLCAIVTRSLDLPVQLEEYWDDLFGGSYSCTHYFETYLLPQDSRPLLLLVDGVDELFAYPEVALDFFGMLRAWYEQGSYGASHEIWQQLRLVITHSMDANFPVSPHQSPLNVGVSILLPAFNLMQMKELAFRYGFEPSELYAEALGNLLGGHPYLLQLSLFHLSQFPQSLEGFIASATAYDSVFSGHLRRQGELLEDAYGCVLPKNRH
ncbi:MAG: hypothetical protein HC795_07565 [Coleofasciculaceae cyanobacterium RL_1_1]|nr:hypothetical protein [Coleofasciculaceae cyanobacterium RL_1_1]